MIQYFVVTFVGDDRPGFVQDIAGAVEGHGGNWLESRMSLLEGKFAGLARIAVDRTDAERLKQSLQRLAENSFSLTIEETAKVEKSDHQQYHLSILGHDRKGIVNEVTGAISSHGINVIELSSNVSAAAMTGIQMFSMEGVVEVPADVDLTTVDGQLAEISQELGIDILLSESLS